MVIYVVRHGQTNWNLENRWQGRSDIALNDNGINQAKDVKKQLSPIKFDICISSPLKRAAKTAEIISSPKCKIIYDNLLIERCFGKREGLIDNDKIPQNYDYNLDNLDENYGDNSFETFRSLLNRAEAFLEKIKQRKEQYILIVSHGEFLKALNYVIVGYDKNTNFDDYQIENCGFHKYEI